MPKEYYIYGLSDPRTKIIRYIGKTTDYDKRYSEQLNRKDNYEKYLWIQELKELNLEPKLVILEVCNEKDWHKREEFYLKKYNTRKNSLFNQISPVKKRTKDTKREKSKKFFLECTYMKATFYTGQIAVIARWEDKYYYISGGENSSGGYYFTYYKKKKYYVPKASILYKTIIEQLPVYEGDKKDIKYELDIF